MLIAASEADRARLERIAASSSLSSIAIDVAAIRSFSPARSDVIVATAGAVAALEPWPFTTVPIVVLGADSRLVRRLLPVASRGLGNIAGGAGAGTVAAVIAAVRHGLVVLSGPVASALAGGERAMRKAEPATEMEEPLTAREAEILDLVALGLHNRDIARRLGISDHTVKFHLASIYGKLGVGSRTAAVRRGLRRGLVTL